MTVRGYASRTASGPQVSRRKKVQLEQCLGPFHVLITFIICKEVLQIILYSTSNVSTKSAHSLLTHAFRIPSDLLDEYERHVESISRQLGPAKLPSYCTPPATGSRASAVPFSTREVSSNGPAGGEDIDCVYRIAQRQWLAQLWSAGASANTCSLQVWP